LFTGVDHQTRFVVIMEGTKTYQLFHALPENDASAANERCQFVPPLYPLDL
jgi:hypothetical protein